MKKTLFCVFLFLISLFSANAANNGYIEEYGRLKLVGTQLCSADGKPIQLIGFSTDVITDESDDFLKEIDFKTMKAWGCSSVRLAFSPLAGEQAQTKLKNYIDLCAANDLYAIVDWHIFENGKISGNPNDYQNEAKAFFEAISAYAKDKGYLHVLYEICSEPGQTTWSNIKAYADEILPIIENNDPGAIVIVGTPLWCQDLKSATDSPIAPSSYKLGIMYSFHISACSHQYLFGVLDDAVKSIPVFVSEWSNSSFDYSGNVCPDLAYSFYNKMSQFGSSWNFWSWGTGSCGIWEKANNRAASNLTQVGANIINLAKFNFQVLEDPNNEEGGNDDEEGGNEEGGNEEGDNEDDGEPMVKANMHVITTNGANDTFAVKDISSIYFEEMLVKDATQGLTVSGAVDGYSYVDLGLKSGTKWATYNVGASLPSETGLYFAWGETETKNDFSWATYKWCEPVSDNISHDFTKYCTNEKYGIVDNKTVLEAEDDAVIANWGNGWRLPTPTEQDELAEGCIWEYVEDFKGTKQEGYLGTSKANGNTIFIPSGESRFYKHAANGGYAYYLSNALSDALDYNNYSSCLYCTPKGVASYWMERYIGLNARAVVSANGVDTEHANNTVKKHTMFIKTTDGKVHSYDAQMVVEVNYEVEDESQKLEGVAESGKVDGYSYVDLGLKSGTKWATYNVGAKSIDERGSQYAWANTEPYFAINRNYKYIESGKYTKYCINEKEGTVDNLRTLEPEDDAATVNWGDAWRTPTDLEQKELIDGCTWEKVSNYNNSGITGMLGTSKENGNTIFLPHEGYWTGINHFGEVTFYGSSTLSDKTSNEINAIEVDPTEYAGYSKIERDTAMRSWTMYVRAVVK